MLYAGAWGMRGLLLNYTTKGQEQGQECALATWKSFPYAQSTTGARRACTGLEPKVFLSTGGYDENDLLEDVAKLLDFRENT